MNFGCCQIWVGSEFNWSADDDVVSSGADGFLCGCGPGLVIAGAAFFRTDAGADDGDVLAEVFSNEGGFVRRADDAVDAGLFGEASETPF